MRTNVVIPKEIFQELENSGAKAYLLIETDILSAANLALLVKTMNTLRLQAP